VQNTAFQIADMTPLIDAMEREMRRRARIRALACVAAIAVLLVGIVRADVARAEEPAVRHWGGSSAMLAPAEGAAVARVICVNRLTSGHAMVLEFPLALGGFGVTVLVEHGAGDVPDRFTVVPPDGFIAVPAFVDVGEHDQGEILIFSVAGVGA
jgi:hypothetical protein